MQMEDFMSKKTWQHALVALTVMPLVLVTQAGIRAAPAFKNEKSLFTFSYLVPRK
jgi:hypothetical protein